MNQEQQERLTEVISKKYKRVHGAMVVQDGKVEYEHYFNGYGSEDTFHVASVTKSVVSALIGIAMEKGYIKSLDQKVLDIFPEYKYSPSDIMKKAVTIRNLLTMTVPYPYKNWNEPLERFSRSKDWVKYALDEMAQKGKLGDFKYSSAGVHLVSAILTRTTGKCAREFANENLFGPTGMKVLPDYQIEKYGVEEVFGDKIKGWARDPAGNTTGGWGLKLSLKDMIRFGQVYLNEGMWDGKQIIPKEWIHETFQIRVEKAYEDIAYGYLWWINPEKEIYMALGAGGNLIYCIPKRKIVIAMASQIVRSPQSPMDIIDEYILDVL